jgi:signal transduction histidine kinase
LIGWLVSSRFTSPLTELTTVTENMAGGDLSSRAVIHTRDEFYSLGQSFNAMAETLEDTIETLRNFITDAAHELLTPVAALRVNLELAREEGGAHKLLEDAEAQTLRMQAIVESLLDLSRIEAGSTPFEPISLQDVLSDLEESWAPLATQKELQLEIATPANDLRILGSRAQITKALDNVLDNAVKFSRPGGHIHLEVAEMTDSIQIIVSDKGIGIPDREHGKVFQRFFRGRNTADIPGSGLGLAIVKAIMDRHEGKVTLDSTQKGTTVWLDFRKAQNQEN